MHTLAGKHAVLLVCNVSQDTLGLKVILEP